jgi:hypothetical protein
MTRPTIRTELAAAIRIVNARFTELDSEQQDRVVLVEDGPLDEALLAGGDENARTQIEAWRDRQLNEIGRAAR